MSTVEFRTGDRVRYWKGAKRGAHSGESTIRACGKIGGDSVVWVDGEGGCIAQTHIERVGL